MNRMDGRGKSCSLIFFSNIDIKWENLPFSRLTSAYVQVSSQVLYLALICPSVVLEIWLPAVMYGAVTTRCYYFLERKHRRLGFISLCNYCRKRSEWPYMKHHLFLKNIPSHPIGPHLQLFYWHYCSVRLGLYNCSNIPHSCFLWPDSNVLLLFSAL